MVTLENRTKRMQVFNLLHDAYCSSSCVCQEAIILTYVHHPKTGVLSPKQLQRKFPASLTIPAKEKAENLNDDVLKVPEIVEAIDRGDLKVLAEKKAAPPKKKKTTEETEK